MNDVRVVKAAEYMKDCICLPDVGEELITESFTLAGSLYETCDVHDLYGCRNNSFRIAESFQYFKSLVWDICRSDIRVYGTEREVCALCLSRADAVEQC